MEQQNSKIFSLQDKPFDALQRVSKYNLSEVFAERNSGYLNKFSFYLVYFNYIPNYVHETNIDCLKANKWFFENYKNEITDHYFAKRYYGNNKKAEYSDIYYVLYDDLVICFDVLQNIVRFLFRKTSQDKLNVVIEGIKKIRKRKSKNTPYISVLVNTPKGISTDILKITKPKWNIEDNYNDDFKEIHQNIFKRLSTKNDKGIVLLHGKPGTGKTSYIRYLISKLKKDVIFLPPNTAAEITNPNLISVLIGNTNSVFVIEDAEKIVMDRNTAGESPVSALLNISDGLLSDCLNIQIICSFNTDISKIDSALLRKGRLIAKYEFKELAIEKAQSLSNKLGFTSQLNLPMTLTAIYNQEEKNYAPVNHISAFGFKTIITN